MEKIIPITGKVAYPITLDPGVWIFDDRRVDLDTFFTTTHEDRDELEDYKKSMSTHWDREIMEGAIYPPTLKTEQKYKKEKVLTGSFAMPFDPFLKHAEVDSDAKKLKLVTDTTEIVLPIEEAAKLILAFSDKGKPLTDNGPVHVYFRDGSNKNEPIKNVRAFIVE